MAIFGKLLKINSNKKLVFKIDQPAYEKLLKSMQLLAKKNNHSDSRLSVWSFEDDFGETQYRLTVKLDKYDVKNMRKFEALLRSDIAINGSLKPYAFIPEGETEQICGVNYELVDIRKLKQTNPRSEFVQPIVSEEIDAEMDKIAAEAEQRVLSELSE